MRILHVYRTFFPDTQGGLEEVIRQICVGTQALGAQTSVLTTSKVARTTQIVHVDGIEVIQVPETFEWASCNVARTMFGTFRDRARSADVVHYHYPWPFQDVLHLTQTSQAATVVTYHSDIIRQRMLNLLYQPLRERFLASADRIVCTSPNYFATSDVLSAHSHKVDVIPIGIDPNSYVSATSADLQAARAAFGENFFFFVGVLRYYKGLHILLEAIQGAPYQVVIAGSGPTERALKQQAAALGLTNVTFAGRITNAMKAALFQLSQAVVFPSYLRTEAFGVTLLEGAMYGKPLISTEIGSGTSHINVDRHTGRVIAPGSARMLRKAMDQLHADPAQAQQWGRQARTRYEQLFTGRQMAQQYSRLYAAVIAQRNSLGA